MEIEDLSWSDFLDSFRWNPGEHVTLLGPTGAGKTTLALDLIERKRRFVLVLAAKPKDPLIADLKSSGFQVFRSWPTLPADVVPRQVLWPKIESASNVREQRETFLNALADVYKQGGWTLYVDELQYLTDREFLGLAPLMKLLWQHGRSLKISVVGGTQRPAHVPLAAYSQATHLFFWQSNDVADLKRLREIGGRVDPKALQAAIQSLEGHDVLYLNTRSGRCVRTLVS